MRYEQAIFRSREIRVSIEIHAHLDYIDLTINNVR